MVRIIVKFFSLIRHRTGIGQVEFKASDPKLCAVLSGILHRYAIKDLILTGSGEIRPWARVLINGRSHDFVGGLDLELHDDDTLALIYPYADNF